MRQSLKHAIPFWLLVAGIVCHGESLPSTRALFEPPDGKTLLLIGQSLEDIQPYVATTKVVPAGFMEYTSTKDGEGVDQTSNAGDGTQAPQKLAESYTHTVLQIGFYLVDDGDAVIHGERNASIDRMADWIKNSGRPVFLRIGYEFDNPDNHYDPKDYVTMFRYIVDRFRRRGVMNVAYVWHSEASRLSRPLGNWYPGDDYVDWVGISYFNQPQGYMQPALDFAKQHGKPVMIAESSPLFVQAKFSNSWNLWFSPLFKFISANSIKALCYINSDWDATDMFRNEKWGDARVQSGRETLARWIQETSKDRYLKSSPELFSVLGWDAKH